MAKKIKKDLIAILLDALKKGWKPQTIIDMVDSLWRDNKDFVPNVIPPLSRDTYVTGASWDAEDEELTITQNNSIAPIVVEIPQTGGGSDVVSGDGMDFETNAPVTLGLPSTIDSATTNALTTHSHTHALGNINVDNITTKAADEYGKLYNWWVTQEDVAPDGWHVPTKAEWETLLNEIDTYDSESGTWPLAGGKLKETGFTHWESPNTGATNEVGFNVIGSGIRQYIFSLINKQCNFWSFTEYEVDGWEDWAYLVSIYSTASSVQYSQIDLKPYAASIRFIKDDSTDPGTVTDYDGNVYPTVKIGDQVWMAENFRGTHLNDGTPIDGPDFTNEEWAALTTPAYCIYQVPIQSVLDDLQQQIDDIAPSLDEKVKYDAADPTAGYLADKIIPGTGISIAEGTGADENKLKISVTPDTAIKVAIDFIDIDELVFVYNCPVALKFTSQESEGADASISPALNTDMAQYGKVTITAAEVGLIVLNGVVL